MSKLNEQQINTIFSELLFPEDAVLTEEISSADKNEIKRIAKKEIEDFLSTNRNPELEQRVKTIIKKEFGGSEFEKKVLEISKNVLIQLYKQLWTRRAFWANDLKNSPS